MAGERDHDAHHPSHDAPRRGTTPLIEAAPPDPAAVWRRIARDLTAAVESARHPFHLLTLATIDPDGLPQIRTVVLRRFDDVADDGRACVWFHTDSRSPKLAQIVRNPAVGLHWYDIERRVQVRVAAGAVVHHGDSIAREAWGRARPMSRACYGGVLPPGEPLDSFPPAPPVPHDDDLAGFAHFAAVGCRFDSLELLELASGGHRRLRLRLDPAGASGQILSP
jgi:pyridoxamine 5'-phosphate oxidase